VRQRLSLRSPARKPTLTRTAATHTASTTASSLAACRVPTSWVISLPDHHADEAEAGADTQGGDQLRHDRGQHEHPDRGEPSRTHAPRGL
jgi:hypothetical protein